MFNKIIRIILLSVILTVFLIGCSNRGDKIEEKSEEGISPMTFRVATLSPAGNPDTDSALFFAKRVEELSDGKIKVNVFPSGQLGDAISIIDQVMLGTIDFFNGDVTFYGNIINDFNVVGMGFVFDDSEHVARFLESPVYEGIKQQLVDKGLRQLASTPRSPRIMFSKKAINSIDDVKGLLMRVPEIPVYMKVWDALGTNTNRVSWGEIYLALSQGVVDAAEGPIDASYDMKFHEVAPYVILTNHVYSAHSLTANEKLWKSLSEPVKEILMQAAEEALEDFFWKANVAYEQEVMDKFVQEGATLIYIDTKPFKDKLLNVVAEFESQGVWSPNLFQAIQDLK